MKLFILKTVANSSSQRSTKTSRLKSFEVSLIFKLLSIYIKLVMNETINITTTWIRIVICEFLIRKLFNWYLLKYVIYSNNLVNINYVYTRSKSCLYKEKETLINNMFDVFVRTNLVFILKGGEYYLVIPYIIMYILNDHVSQPSLHRHDLWQYKSYNFVLMVIVNNNT